MFSPKSVSSGTLFFMGTKIALGLYHLRRALNIATLREMNSHRYRLEKLPSSAGTLARTPSRWSREKSVLRSDTLLACSGLNRKGGPMAVWQFDMYFIARGMQAPDLNAEGWETPALPLPLVYDVQKDLAHCLGPPWLMLPDWLVFGPEKGNRVDVLFENEAEGSIFVRCDVREKAPQFLVLVSDLAQSHECRFFSPQSREFIEPSLETVLSAIKGR
jgi:hypothetical protein